MNDIRGLNRAADRLHLLLNYCERSTPLSRAGYRGGLSKQTIFTSRNKRYLTCVPCSSEVLCLYWDRRKGNCESLPLPQPMNGESAGGSGRYLPPFKSRDDFARTLNTKMLNNWNILITQVLVCKIKIRLWGYWFLLQSTEKRNRSHVTATLWACPAWLVTPSGKNYA